MITLNELTYDILETVRNHRIVDDLDIDERQVHYLIHNQRALWIRRELNQPGRNLDPNLIQDLGCVDLEIADRSECPDMPIGCSILRTKCTIPTTIELHDKPAITRVGPVDRLGENYSFVPYHQAVYSGNGKFNQRAIFAFLHNNRIYIKASGLAGQALEKINIRGVFEDPTNVDCFCNCDGSVCYSNDEKYPLNRWMVPFIKDPIIKQFMLSQQMPEDNANDSNSNKIGQ